MKQLLVRLSAWCDKWSMSQFIVFVLVVAILSILGIRAANLAKANSDEVVRLNKQLQELKARP